MAVTIEIAATVAPSSLRRDLRRAALRDITRVIGRGAVTFVLTLVVVVAAWQAIDQFSGISPYVAKGPLDVLRYLTSDPTAAANRSTIFGDLWVTLGDTFVGFVAGLAVALIGAVLFQLSRGLEQALMPMALLLASVPLVAVAPVIILISGRSEATVAIIGGIVVLFPSLVSIAFGLRSVPPQIVDVISVYGGSAWTAIVKAGLPSALPSLFSALRISIPAAITGALLTEWLATGKGIGNAVQIAIPQALFTQLWANVAIVTITSLVLYNLVRIIESAVLARMGMNVGR